MAEQQTIIVGVFEDRQAALQSIKALHASNFQDEQLSFATRSRRETTGEGQEATGSGIERGIIGGILGAADVLLAPITGPSDAATLFNSALPAAEDALDRLPHRKAQPVPSEASNTGKSEQEPADQEERASIITGGVVGGVAGAAAALIIPGIGPAVAAGWLAAILGGAAFGGVAGGFLGAFTHMGIPQHKARHYEQALKAGHILVTVKTTDRQQEAIAILRRHGAHDVEAH